MTVHQFLCVTWNQSQDAHNTQLKKKMSLDEFIRNNRGIDDGQDLPKELLQRLYVSITTRAIQMAEEGVTGLLTPTLFADLYRRYHDTPYVNILQLKFGMKFYFAKIDFMNTV